MSLAPLLNHPLCWIGTLALLHFLWQGAAIAGGVAVGLRWLGSARPQHRYLLMLAGLLAMAVAPALTAGRLAMSGESLSPSPSAAVQQLEFLEPTGSEALSVDPFALRPQDAAEAPVELSGLGSAPHRWMPWLLCGWLTGVFLLSGRLIFGAVIVARLRQGSRPLPASLGVAVRRMRSQLRLGHGVAVLIGGPHIGEALAAGLFRPCVLLPASWVLELPPEVLEAIIAHELAHIRRWDLWVNVCQRVLETLLFYHPAVWWLSGRLRVERELCCDELAVAVTGERMAYARALELVARRNLAGERPVLTAGIGDQKMALLRRIRHVLGLKPTERESVRWSAGLLALAAPVLLYFVSTGYLTAAADGEQAAQREGEGEREGGRELEGDRPREGERERPGAGERDGDRPREGAREGERFREGAREGERPREGVREGARPGLRDGERPREFREGPPREGERRFDDRPREGEVRRDGDGRRPIGPRDGEGPPRIGPRDGEGPPRTGPRDGDARPAGERPFPPRDGEFRGEAVRPPLPPPNDRQIEELLHLIRELRGEVASLRKEVDSLRSGRPAGARPADGERRPDGERRIEGERPRGEAGERGLEERARNLRPESGEPRTFVPARREEGERPRLPEFLDREGAREGGRPQREGERDPAAARESERDE